MKKPVYLLLLLAGIALLPACKKNDAKKEVQIDATNLTACREGDTCEYRYSEHADVDSNFNLHTGAYRLFWSRQQLSANTRGLYVRAPLDNKSFELSKDDIIAGRVKWFFSCPACYSIPYVAVGGYVKGINTTPNKPADQTIWLLEAQILLSTTTDSKIQDTIKVKQYFSPNFVLD
ncbi:MAG: hypothetical protein EOO39_36460 [Cytophagaceae bacterium]|nr:MAG: hypothetical protein EOO39_36460 [Cytophagaceae bacterium]